MKSNHGKLEELLTQYYAVTNDIAKKILEEIKSNNQNYEGVKKDLNRFRQATMYVTSNIERYEYLLNRVKEMLEEEMNGLPLTSHSRPELLTGGFYHS